MTNKENENEKTYKNELSGEAEVNETENKEQGLEELLSASGSDEVLIKKHNLVYENKEEAVGSVLGVELEVTNISDSLIGAALFEAAFFDEEGNLLNTGNYKLINWPSNYSRTIRIPCSAESTDRIKNYQVKLIKTATAPKPTVADSEKLNILKHKLIEACEEPGLKSPAGVEIAVRNAFQRTIATVVFEAEFFDIEGNVVSTIKHYEFEIKPGFSRSIFISSEVEELNIVKSYDVRIKRITTTDLEKVQLRWKKIETNENGEEEIAGAVKNISDDISDAVIFATFFDRENENIGTKTTILKDIEPGSVRQFQFNFKPQPGDKVVTCVMNVGDLTE
ncbi:MAG: FxLYD domain-containing protein [Dehalococcoidales bacterium]